MVIKIFTLVLRSNKKILTNFNKTFQFNEMIFGVISNHMKSSFIKPDRADMGLTSLYSSSTITKRNVVSTIPGSNPLWLADREKKTRKYNRRNRSSQQ